MARWLLLGLCVVASACKIVTSTGDGDGDGGVSGPPVVGFAATNVQGSESIGNAYVEVTMSRTSNDPVSITYTTVDGTATHGLDYELQQGTVILDPGSNEYPLYIPIHGDTLEENDETFTVVITAVTGARIGRGSTQVTILSNHKPSLGFTVTSQIQSEASVTNGIIELRLSEPSSVDITVTYALDGTATPNEDYFVSGLQTGPATLPLTAPPFTIPAGTFSLYSQLPMSIYNDGIDEPDETIIATLLSANNATIGNINQHTFTIRDDDAPPTVSFTTTTSYYYEGTGAGTTVTPFTVYLSSPMSVPVTVPFSIAAGVTSASVDDYTITTTSPLTFQPGQTDLTIDVQLVGDSNIEGTETLALQLGTPTNAGLGFYTLSQLLIRNDDCLGSSPFTACPDETLAGDVVLPADLDTDYSGICAYNPGWEFSPNTCVVFARTISVNSTVVHGWRPLILVATDSIDIATSLDVTPQPGAYVPGVGWSSCYGNAGGTQSGGAGGTFMTAGGAGGSHSNAAGTGGAPGVPSAAPTYLRSGCSGYLGGDNTLGTSYGRGGGVIQLVAGNSITVHPGAVVNASGEPAHGSSDLSAGGSGGGSGGMLVFWAPTITATGAYILANGAGGAEGGSSSAGGTSGSAPNPLAPLTAAPGGSGTQGGNGGDGFAEGKPATAGTSTNNNNGAGGGGGGAGYIHTNKPFTGATVSPAPS